jgi:hypothetical protein
VNGLKKLSNQKGEFSFVSICQNSAKFIKNPPLNHNGEPIPLFDFTQMEEQLLIRWRNHIVDSFRDDSAISHPLRFLRLNGEEPTLTILRMGSKTKEPLSNKRTASERNNEEEEDAGKGRGKGKGKGKRKGKGKGKTVRQGKKSKAAVSDESEASSSEEDASNEDEPLPKRPKLHRAAGDKAKGGIQESMKHLESYEQSSSSRPKPRPKTADSVTEPGSNFQVQMKVLAKENRSNVLQDSNSLFLQLRSMTNGTLIDDWKAKGFNADKASAFSEFSTRVY